MKSAYFCIFYRFFGTLTQEKKIKKNLEKKNFQKKNFKKNFKKKRCARVHSGKKEIVVWPTQDTIFVRIEDSFRTFGLHRRKFGDSAKRNVFGRMETEKLFEITNHFKFYCKQN